MQRWMPGVVAVAVGCAGAPDEPACEVPVGVEVTVTSGGWPMEAEVGWRTADGASGPCTSGEVDGAYSCAPTDASEVTVTAALAGHAEAADHVAAGAGCRGEDPVALALELELLGAPFPEDRSYERRRYADEAWGDGWAEFCAGGYAEVIDDDLGQAGRHAVSGDVVTVDFSSDFAGLPLSLAFTVVSDTELVDWNGDTWFREETNFPCEDYR